MNGPHDQNFKWVIYLKIEKYIKYIFSVNKVTMASVYILYVSKISQFSTPQQEY